MGIDNLKRLNLGLTDAGNADRLVDRYGDRLRFCKSLGWLSWDGTRWRRDDLARVKHLAKETAAYIYIEILLTNSAGEKKAIGDWAYWSHSQPKIRAMVSLAESDPKIAVTTEQLDRNPMAFNVLNGTLDLESGQLKQHKNEDLITKLAHVEYDPEAECPLWDLFLNRIMEGSQNKIKHLQKAAGYALTGKTTEQVLIILYGSGANGKSTFTETLLAVFGDYGKQAAPGLLKLKGYDSHPTGVADLLGARFVVSAEFEQGRRLDETLVKHLTGGDRLKARYMRQDFFEFDPTHKLFLMTNHKPTIKGTDYAIWRRMNVIPFTVQIPPQERDPELKDKLIKELPGILRWMVEGCLAWQKEGLGMPEEVKVATQAYREEMDRLGGFLMDRCNMDPEAEVTSSDLYQAYEKWCEENEEEPLAKNAFGISLGERGLRNIKIKVGGQRQRGWSGVCLVDERTDPNADSTINQNKTLRTADNSETASESVRVSGRTVSLTDFEEEEGNVVHL